MEINATAFPAPIAQSSSWDPSLQYQGVAEIRGIQSNPVIATVKHYVVTVALRQLRIWRVFAIGRNRWYLTTGRGVRGVLKVQAGHVQEIGLIERRLTASRAAARHVLAGFS